MARKDNQSGASTIGDDAGLPAWKRVLDLALIALSAPVAVLIGGGVALLVWCGSPGPVLFRQKRVGFKGRQFVCLKFRTMHVGAETDSHKGHTTELIKSGTAMTKLDAKKDPRVIPFGSILRATGIDELPQLLNVVRGEMSIVGPRPCIPYEYDLYNEHQRRRFDAVPGLTGLWQVSGKNRTTFSRMIELDVEYSKKKSLWLDLKIISKTIPALVIQCQDMKSKRDAQKGQQNAPTASATVIARPIQSV